MYNNNIESDNEYDDMLRGYKEKFEEFDRKVSEFLYNINKSRYDDDCGNESIENLGIIIEEDTIMEQETSKITKIEGLPNELKTLYLYRNKI